MVDEEYCRKCGVKLNRSNRKYVEKANAYFCKKCAAELEAHYTAEYTCAICGKKFARGELKILLPTKAFEDETLPAERRFVCVDCYSKLGNRTISKVSSSNASREDLKKEIRKSIINKTLTHVNS